MATESRLRTSWTLPRPCRGTGEVLRSAFRCRAFAREPLVDGDSALVLILRDESVVRAGGNTQDYDAADDGERGRQHQKPGPQLPVPRLGSGSVSSMRSRWRSVTS